MSISAVFATTLKRVNWCSNGAQVNKQGYEQQYEVMKRSKPFDIFTHEY
ncbi:hypothetical protein BN190_1080002 [Clostridioides difficile T14]|nr:hypothetical protein HMPREF9945_01922 [Clostridioides difficile 70-100-2010]CCL06023.1 hypothetical protein BN168_330022 [Clostridioides difficile CD002]CCL82587.1 hypothetical protein BN187_950016 [Clostridioides difficile E12]CCL86042.1 hypothetical protein BN188_790017 [Clostridioides difficile T19]CCL90163.1 hypothetical protein BN190_1080002 [Clostridioides difficile T14]